MPTAVKVERIKSAAIAIDLRIRSSRVDDSKLNLPPLSLVAITRGAGGDHPPTAPRCVGQGSEDLRRLLRSRRFTTDLRLRVSPERSRHVIRAGPRAHQLGIVAEPLQRM